MIKLIRQLMGQKIQDPSTISNLEYSDAAGSKKVSEVGRHLLPIGDGAGGLTTNATTARILPKQGACLAVYNNAGAVGAITLGNDNTVTAQAPGAVDTNGNPGVACAPNAWTYIACSNQQWVIASAATLLVYLIDDNSYIRQEASK
jgi:hypothetical protein